MIDEQINAGRGTGDVPIRDAQGKIISYESKDRMGKELKELFNRPLDNQTKMVGNVSPAIGNDGKTQAYFPYPSEIDASPGSGGPSAIYSWIEQGPDADDTTQADVIIGGPVNASNIPVSVQTIAQLLLHVLNSTNDAEMILASGQTGAEFYTNQFFMRKGDYQFDFELEGDSELNLRDAARSTNIRINTGDLPDAHTAQFFKLNIAGTDYWLMGVAD